MCLIGSLIVCEPEKRATFSAVRSIITRECFYQADHQIYFDALCDLYERGSKLDGAVVAEEMRRRQIYEEVGGNEYLTLLIMSVPTHRHAATYARTIKEKSLLRSLIALSNDAIRDAYSPSQEDVAQKSLMDFASKASKLAAGGSSYGGPPDRRCGNGTSRPAQGRGLRANRYRAGLPRQNHWRPSQGRQDHHRLPAGHG